MIFALLFIFCFADAFSTFPQSYGGLGLSKESLTACTPVAITGVQKGKVTVLLSSLSMIESSSTLPDIPLFIFRLAERDKFLNMMDPVNLNFKSSSMRWEHAFNGKPQHRFDISVKEQYANEGIEYYNGSLESSIWNKDNKRDVSVSLEVSHSGVYCSCILLPENVENVDINLEIYNSYGYLPLPVYLEHVQLGYYIIIISIIVCFSLFSLFSRRTMNNVIFIYYFRGVMLPTFAISTLKFSYNFCANHKSLYDVFGMGVDPIFIQILGLLESIIYIVSEFILLLLVMGLGSIYQNDEVRSFQDDLGREFPRRLKKKAVLLLSANIIFRCVRIVLSKYGDISYRMFDYFSDYIEKHQVNAYHFIAPFVDFVDTFFPFFWLSMGSLHYLRNLMSFQRIKNSNNGLKPYTLSIIFSFFIPVIAGATYFALVVKKVSSSGRSFDNPRSMSARPLPLQENEKNLFFTIK